MIGLIKKSTATNVVVFMQDDTDPKAGKTGLTLTVEASKDAAAFSDITSGVTITELKLGWYKIALTSTHTNTSGFLALLVTGTGAVQQNLVYQVVDWNFENTAETGDLPANFADLAITASTGKVTVGTNDDKSGYTLTAGDKDDIVDRTWDEPQSGHVTAGTFGDHLDAEVSTRSSHNASDASAAVWDASRGAHVTAGTFGEGVHAESLNTQAKADVNAEADTALTDYDPPTKAEMDAGFAALNDLSAAEVNAEVDTALADYDGPTKAEMDAGFAALNDPTAAAIADAVWDEALADHQTAGSTGEALEDADATADPSAIADAVWDETLADHTAPGSTGEALSESGASAGDIADAVWDEVRSGHTAAGTFGKALDDVEAKVLANLDTAVSSRADSSSLAAVAADALASKVAAESADTHALIIRRLKANRWRIDPVANTFTIFEANGVTPYQVLDLKDQDGNPTSVNVFERDPQSGAV